MTNPTISIIFGTYNRFECLKRAVESIRKSVGPHSYEIVITDGGSTDGSLEWMREQSDIVVADTGNLDGAVSAFNCAWAASRGEFVANFNDDAQYVDDALAKGIEELRADPKVGQVALELDRTGIWSFDVVRGKMYANYGIGRRDVIERVCDKQGGPLNYWNPIYHTYAADCEHSCWTWKLGFEVKPLPGCRVHDNIHMDALREKNARERSQRNDSQMFYLRWSARADMVCQREGTPAPVLSVLLGTYNRFECLKRAVESIRTSVGPHSYEIVITDGGSTDGSLEWMRDQSDIVVADTGNLDGAVSAFNCAWAASRGEFVANFNDDAQYVDDALAKGIEELRADPKVGQVAFVFNRRGWFEAYERLGFWFANYGMSRRSVIEEVCSRQGGPLNYWNPIYRTYSADGEHSLWIWSLGYEVRPLDDSRVADHSGGAQDDLRETNMSRALQEEQLFYRRWPDEESIRMGKGNRVEVDVNGARARYGGMHGMFCQYNEESILQQHFSGRAPVEKRFLDIGAYDGQLYSNTRMLAMVQRWSGVCVEASPAVFEQLARLYREGGPVACVCAALTEGADGEIMLYESGDPVSTTERPNMEQFAHISRFVQNKVRAMSVATLLRTHPGPYDFVSVDTEGTSADLALAIPRTALSSNALVCVEHGTELDRLTSGMGENGLEFLCSNGVNAFYRVPS